MKQLFVKVIDKLFGKSKMICPISVEDKDYLEDCLLYLEEVFGKDLIKNKRVLLPNDKVFQKPYYGEYKDVKELLGILCSHMEINADSIELSFYKERQQIEFSEGLSTVYEKDTELTSGKYIEYEDGSIEIKIEENLLTNLPSLIATLAHELAHYKLLGEKRIDDNDEVLTELTVLIYGLGIFNANSSVISLDTWSGTTHTGWKVSGGEGYLHYKLHGFALALYANYRGDRKPYWLGSLAKDVLKIYHRSMRYIVENEKQIRFK
jgi:hypothetical protein